MSNHRITTNRKAHPGDIEKMQQALELWREVFTSDIDPSHVTRDGDKHCIFCDAWLDVGENPHEPDCIYIRAKELVG